MFQTAEMYSDQTAEVCVEIWNKFEPWDMTFGHPRATPVYLEGLTNFKKFKQD